MAELTARLRADLAAAIKSKDTTRISTLRMALSAISTAAVAGDSARELADDEVVQILTKEAKKRRESADAFAGAGRDELAAQERAEGDVLAEYLPAQLSDEEVAELARAAVADVADQLGERPGPRQMGQVMKVANSRAAGRAEGARIAAAVRAVLESPGPT